MPVIQLKKSKKYLLKNKKEKEMNNMMRLSLEEPGKLGLYFKKLLGE
ncbi:hypothetical protein H8E88_31285 [candidate division KSB1 bacterium]|nr:hypothetical protein [candidate division KSB1 bacterium]